jgi:general secretion pathway protein N
MIPRRAKRVAGVGALLLATYLVSLLALFPASLAWRLAEPGLELPFALDLGTPSGRIWSGRAGAVTVNNHDIGSVVWRWRPGALLTGRLGLALEWRSGADAVQGQLRLGRAYAEVSGVRGTVGASRLQAWFKLPVLLDGPIDLDIARIRWSADAGFEAAEGALLWADAAGGLPRAMPLGQYRADLEAVDGALGTRIESAPGAALVADGTASWRPAGTYRVDLLLRAGSGADRNLASALDAIARRQPDGSHRLLVTTRPE